MYFVTPCVGVWIETNNWEPSPQMGEVTPCVGVWIETINPLTPTNLLTCHTLRGCVD